MDIRRRVEKSLPPREMAAARAALSALDYVIKLQELRYEADCLENQRRRVVEGGCADSISLGQRFIEVAAEIARLEKVYGLSWLLQQQLFPDQTAAVAEWLPIRFLAELDELAASHDDRGTVHRPS